MSSPDPTLPADTPPPDTAPPVAPVPPVAPTPPTPPGPTNPLNPLLLANVSVIGAFALAFAALIVMTVLAIIYDGSYAQALLQVAQTVVYGGLGVGGATTLAHQFGRRDQ